MTTVKKAGTPVKASAAPDAITALTKGVHTFHLADSNASYTYTDADAALVRESFGARVAVDKADEKLAPCLVRIFGNDWTKDGAAPELKKPVREFIRTVLPEYQSLLTKRAQYQAAAKAGAVDTSAATGLRIESQLVEQKITRMIESAGRIWRDHLAAQDPDFVPAQKQRNTQSGIKIIEKAQESLDKRAGKNVTDAEFCKVSSMLLGQVVKGRAALFISAMRFGASHKLSDEDVVLLLKNLPVEVIGKILRDAKKETAAA